MPTLRTGLAVLTVAVVVLAACGGGDDDKTTATTSSRDVTFSVTLDGRAVAPGPSDPDGTAQARITVVPGTSQVCATITTDGLDGVTGAHVHEGRGGTAGPIAVTLPAPTTGSADGCVPAPATVVDAITGGIRSFYVDVHTTDYPDGAVRAQLDGSIVTEDRLYFRQLLAGRDFARGDDVARQMVNFVYLVGDRETGEALVVDPAYGVRDLVEIAGGDGLSIVGALVTHYHPDHVGGSMMGWDIEGVAELLALDDVDAPIHVNRAEARGVRVVTGASESDLVLHEGGDVVTVGSIPVTLVHTPGHTPGSQCFLVDGRLVAGDTLFLDGCGRTDLPGGDPDEMYLSLTQRLAAVPDDTMLYPGHQYSPEASLSLGETRARNYVFRLPTLEQWRMMFG